jgi:hypothetical protein
LKAEVNTHSSPFRLAEDAGGQNIFSTLYPRPPIPKEEQILKIANTFEMDNLTLYSDARLPCPQRVLITAKELGIKLNIIHVDITKDDHKEPTHSDPFLPF